MKISPYYFEEAAIATIVTSTTEQEIKAAKNLIKLYTKLLEEIVSNKTYTDTTPTHINGGIALSSQHALDCLEDLLRTTRFIKGIYQAIQDSLVKFPEERIEILYAGCGPAAPLLIPLLTLFTPRQLSITLMDINDSSIQSTKKLVNALDASAYIKEYVLTDATTYRHKNERPFHVIISETMDKGLIKEPQLRIMQNLAPQLVEGGIFIPEKIKIYREHTFFSKEYLFELRKEHTPPLSNRLSVQSEHLFTITKDIEPTPPFSFESGLYDLPEDYTETPDITIVALLEIYGKQQLNKTDSLLTNPVCVSSMYALSRKQYKLHYTTEGIPSWKCVAV